MILSFLGSCASNDLRKFGTKKYFQRKVIHMHNRVQTHTTYGRVEYVQSKENHCFETIDDREVYTVSESDIENAIRYFYFRSTSHDLKVVTRDGYQMLEITANKSAQIDLEVAYCAFQIPLLLDSFEARYASFRLARKTNLTSLSDK